MIGQYSLKCRWLTGSRGDERASKDVLRGLREEPAELWYLECIASGRCRLDFRMLPHCRGMSDASASPSWVRTGVLTSQGESRYL